MRREHERDNDDEEQQQQMVERPYQAYDHKIITRQLHFYISGPIEEPAKYAEMVHSIRMSQPTDVVHIHLNTPGGSLATGVQIINAMRASYGHIVTHLEGEACSMGAILFLAGDEIVVYDNSVLMFHNYSGGMSGKGHEMTASIDAANKWYHKLARNVCTPFLTEEEMKKMFEGAELWMLSDEVQTRLKKMEKKLKADERKKARESVDEQP
jgi:ATP-dependent protease ClpP protease subunit